MDSPETQIKMLQSGKAAEGETLKDVLSKETYAKLESHSKESGLPIAVFDPLRPWMVAVALITTEIVKLGYNPEDGVDKYFWKAKKDKKETTPLETLDLQLGLFTGLTKQEQDAMLRETLQEISGFKDLQGIIDAWKTGDTKPMETFMLEAMKDYPQLHKKLLVDRNKQWVDKLQKLHASRRDGLCRGGRGAHSRQRQRGRLVERQGLKGAATLIPISVRIFWPG